jgi:hypothetical protein
VTSSITWRSTGSSALARTAERRRAIRSLVVPCPGNDVLVRRVAQQLVEAQQGLLEVGAPADRALVSLRSAGTGVRRHGTRRRGAGRRRRALGRTGVARCRFRHAREQPAQRPRARRLGGLSCEGRPRRQHDSAIEARLDPLRLEPRRRRGGGVLEQTGRDTGRGAQDDRALDLRL